MRAAVRHSEYCLFFIVTQPITFSNIDLTHGLYLFGKVFGYLSKVSLNKIFKVLCLINVKEDQKKGISRPAQLARFISLYATRF